MTDEEALALKRGDRVEALVKFPAGPRWLPARVTGVECGVCPFRGRWAEVRVRTDEPGPNGKPRQLDPRTAREVRFPVRLDRFTANAFADFLDERGEHKAAAMLREAFPLVAADGSVPAQEAS